MERRLPLRTGKLATLAAIGLVLATTTACGNDSKAPEPNPSGGTGFSFDVAAQYTAHTTVGSDHAQDIILTVGKPRSVNAYKALGGKVLCVTPAPATDLYIPLHLQVINTSPHKAAMGVMGVSLSFALDSDAIDTFAISVQDEGFGTCQPRLPLKDATEQSIVVGEKPNPLDAFSPPGGVVPYGSHMTGQYYLMWSGGEAPPPPLSALFIRLTPTANADKFVPAYVVGSLRAVITTGDAKDPTRAKDGVAGVVTSGPGKGAFYIPIDPAASPCALADEAARMDCGPALNAPK